MIFKKRRIQRKPTQTLGRGCGNRFSMYIHFSVHYHFFLVLSIFSCIIIFFHALSLFSCIILIFLYYPYFFLYCPFFLVLSIVSCIILFFIELCIFSMHHSIYSCIIHYFSFSCIIPHLTCIILFFPFVYFTLMSGQPELRRVGVAVGAGAGFWGAGAGF